MSGNRTVSRMRTSSDFIHRFHNLRESSPSLLHLGKAVSRRASSLLLRVVQRGFARMVERTLARARSSFIGAGSCDDLLVLVDKATPLPRYYVPRDLVSLRSCGISTLWQDILLRQEAAEQLTWLVSAAAEASEELVVLSAYRSFEDQRGIFSDVSVAYGKDADRWCARPGHSQHQLGTAVDFTNEVIDYALGWSFAGTSAGQWLLQHAGEYGFVLAYPEGGEAETGYQWEPWHYRYIGVENTQRLRASGLSLQAFLLRKGVLPRANHQSAKPRGRPS